MLDAAMDDQLSMAAGRVYPVGSGRIPGGNTENTTAQHGETAVVQYSCRSHYPAI